MHVKIRLTADESIILKTEDITAVVEGHNSITNKPCRVIWCGSGTMYHSESDIESIYEEIIQSE